MIDLRRKSREPIWAWADRIAEALMALVNIRGDNRTARVRREGNAMIVEAIPATGLDLSVFWFGWLGPAATPQTVGIRGGPVQGNGFYQTLQGANVACGGNASDPHLIIATGTDSYGSISGNSVLASGFTGHTTNEWRVPLYEVYLSDSGKVVMSAVGKIGCLDLSSWNPP